MNALFGLLLSLSLSASLVMALIFAAGKLFKRRLDHAWHYYIWLVVIVRLLVPYAPETNLIDLIAQENQQPVTIDTVIQTPQTANMPVASPQTEIPTANANNPSDKTSVKPIDIKAYLWIIWAAVAVAMFVWKAFGYMRFIHFSARGRKRIENPVVLDIYQSTIRVLKLRHAPLLYRSRIAGVPMLIGLFRPCILIPDTQIDKQNLYHILLHELTHYKRRDGFYKWLVQITVCIHWFNPLVYFMAKEVDNACELSCDEAVVRRLSRSERRIYGDMLLNSLQYSIQAPGRVMTLPLSKDGRLMRTRLNAIMNFRHMRMSGIIISLLLSACIATGAAFAGAYSTQTESLGNEPNTTIDGDNSEPHISNQQDILPDSQELSTASQESVDDTEQITRMSFEKLHEQIEDMLPWMDSLDKDIYSDFYYAPEGSIEEREYIVLQVTDVDTFRQSPAMTEAEENGWVFDLEEVRYSANEIDALITKMLNWDRRQELQISIFGASHDKSTMSVGTTNLSPQNRATIEEFVGIGPLEFYNPEIANEVTGTGEYRMLGLDGIIDWYVPRLFDKPFVYNVLVKAPGISVFSNGDSPDMNFYLQI